MKDNIKQDSLTFKADLIIKKNAKVYISIYKGDTEIDNLNYTISDNEYDSFKKGSGCLEDFYKGDKYQFLISDCDEDSCCGFCRLLI